MKPGSKSPYSKFYFMKGKKSAMVDFHNKISILDDLQWKEKSYNEMFKFYIFSFSL